MEEKIVGVICLSVGCLMLFFHRAFARKIIEQQNKFWGFRFDRPALKSAEIVSIIVGSGFLVFGVLSFFQIIRFK